MTFQLIHADPHLLVLDKPAGLLAVPGRGPDKQDCLSARVQAVHPDARVVHRLDMATSGLLLMARGAEVQRTLGLAFAERRVDKRYVALVAGAMAPPQTPDGWGLIDLPLIVDWPNRPRSKVDFGIGKPSQTRWRVLARSDLPGLGPATRLELAPLTGRSHQLRVHLLALGHPILGDDLYGPPDQAASRLHLHASELLFVHPVSGDTLRFASPAPF
ncbi:MAG: RluA family pseudouridine synthase [Pseudomonadota bacterium]